MHPFETLKIHSCPELIAWLGDMLSNNPNGSGFDLVMRLYGPDNVSRADTLLQCMEKIGWIQRTAFRPAPEQEFFGVGSYKSLREAKEFHGQLHLYKVKDVDAVRAYVGDKMPAKAAYVLGDLVKYRSAFVQQIQGGISMHKATGWVVGFAFDGSHPRVSWTIDPQDEPACQALIEEPPRCLGGRPCACPRVPYSARAVAPSAIQKVKKI